MGSFDLPIGTGFDLGEKFTLEIAFGTNRRRTVFNRGWTGAAIGVPAISLKISPYLHGAAAAEMSRFLGDSAFDYSGGLKQGLADVFQGVGFTIVSESSENADSTPPAIPYSLQAQATNLALVDHGPLLQGEGYVTADLTYEALYNPADGTLFDLLLVNKLTDAFITNGC
jgi:hypothetical protein